MNLKSKAIMIIIFFPTVGGLLALLWLALVPPEKEAPYRFVAAWGKEGSGPGEFRDPTGIAIGGSGAGSEVFVADARNARIQVFDLGGHFTRQFGRTERIAGGKDGHAEFHHPLLLWKKLS